MKCNELVFVWDNDYLGKEDGGNIIRKYKKSINKNHHLVQMNDGQLFDYNNAIPVTDFRCPKCGSKYVDNKSNLVLGREAIDDNGNQLVSPGYSGACLNCDEDFYLFELLKSKKT